MPTKRVYDALDKIEGGADIIAMIKQDFAPFKDLDAQLRLTKQDYEKQMEELKSIAKAEPNTELEKRLQAMSKQVETLSKTVETEREEKTRLQKQSQIDRLKSEVSSDLSSVFGKFGGVLADNLITSGKLRFDDNGTVIGETDTGIYQKKDYLEVLKKEYAENIIAKPTGSGNNPPKGTDKPANGDSFEGKSSLDLMRMASENMMH